MNQHLTQYIQTGSSDAFRLLVTTHTNAVYSQSLRHLRDPALAEDATQTVFITLAHKARRISPNAILAGWLFNTTRHCCATLQRTEARRRKHEKNAMTLRAQQTTNDSTDHADAEPLLNNALEKLRTRERDAILLRYFQGQTLREVGVALGVSEDAAKQQIARALEKLRHWFAREGITIPTAMITTTLASAVKPAPSHLASKLGALNIAKPTILWPWLGSKVAASIVVGTIAAVGATATVIALADGRSTPNTVAPAITAPAIPASAAVADTPLDTLRRLAAAIRADDHTAIDACFTDETRHPEAAALIRNEIYEDAAWIHVQRASQAAFKTKNLPLQHFGFTRFPFMDGGLETMIDKMLEAPTPPTTTIDNDTARVLINLPNELFAGTGGNRILDQEHWTGAILTFKQINNQWKLDLTGSINLVAHISVSDRNADNLKVEQRLSGMITDAIDDVATKIESGELSSAKTAGDVLDRTVMDAFKTTHTLGYTTEFLPVLGGN